MKIANTKLLVGACMALTLTMLSPAVLANDNNDIRKALQLSLQKKLTLQIITEGQMDTSMIPTNFMLKRAKVKSDVDWRKC